MQKGRTLNWHHRSGLIAAPLESGLLVIPWPLLALIAPSSQVVLSLADTEQPALVLP